MFKPTQLGIVALMSTAMATFSLGCAHRSESTAKRASDGLAAKSLGAQQSAVAHTRWSDLGTLPFDEETKVGLTQKFAYVLSGQKLYKKPITDGAWEPIASFEDEVSDIFTISEEVDTIIVTVKDGFETLPLRISHDGGQTFQAYGAEFSDQPDKIGAEYEVPSQFFKEESGRIFASLSGLKTAVSEDLGRTWSYLIGKGGKDNCVGGESLTITLPAHPGVIFKSQDCPLQDSTLASIQNAPNEQKLEKLIDESFLGQKSPNTLAASASLPDTLFIGVENGVVRYNVKEKKTDWLLDSQSTEDWQGYVTNIWVDPRNAEHIVVSGNPRDSRLDFLLFESFDGGKNFESLRTPNDPEGQSPSMSGATFGNRLAIATKESDNATRIWLFRMK